MLEIFIILVLLQVKHWYIDFVNQSDDEVKHKGVYLHWLGVKHSLKHSIGTFFVLGLFSPLYWALALAIFDFVTHYHIDWAKMNYGNRDITTKDFWNHLGMDQMAHQIVYIIIAGMLIL